jgi:hypothetical protein
LTHSLDRFSSSLDLLVTVVYACGMKRFHSATNLGMAFALLTFLPLADPLRAKCPVYSVEVRGKIERSFKPGDKVLVTLIFSDNQFEPSGEETAIDIHNATFSGRVAFSTYSYSSLLGGDKCHRRPKNALIRLIDADGQEEDRTSLKIGTDFNYDEKQGEYTLRFDVELNGWCQPQCDGASPSSATNWRKVDAGPFSILAPSGWELHQLPGTDSYVGEFVGDGVAMRFDFGRYSNPLKEEKKPAYVVIQKPIGGRPAKVVNPRTPGHGITGVYFRNVGDSNSLCLWGRDLTPAQQELVLKIFETLRFGGPLPPYVLPPPPPTKNVQ